jgi:hypothetical protein
MQHTIPIITVLAYAAINNTTSPVLLKGAALIPFHINSTTACSTSILLIALPACKAIN